MSCVEAVQAAPADNSRGDGDIQMSRLAILTPTYNRAENLGTLFLSLSAQTNGNFEWWVVDDGSTDHTKETVCSFIAQAQFPIHYIYKENGGKHTAINAAIREITAELTIIVDSDDTLTGDAVETIHRYHNKYASYTGLCGYVFLKQSQDGAISGKRFVPNERVASYADVRVNGDDTYADKAEVFYTCCLKEFPFPEFSGEKFLGEDVVWLQMGRKYSMVHINQVIYLFEYRKDGLTKNRRRHNIASSRGCMHRATLYMEKDIKLRYRIKATLQYLIYGRFAGENVKTLVHGAKYKLLPMLLAVPAQLIYATWRYKYK